MEVKELLIHYIVELELIKQKSKKYFSAFKKKPIENKINFSFFIKLLEFKDLLLYFSREIDLFIKKEMYPLSLLKGIHSLTIELYIILSHNHIDEIIKEEDKINVLFYKIDSTINFTLESILLKEKEEKK